MEGLIICTETQLQNYFNSLEESIVNAIKESKKIDKHTKEWLTIKEVSELLNISIQTVHNWCKSGVLVKHNISRAVRFKSSEVNEAMKRLETKRKKNKIT